MRPFSLVGKSLDQRDPLLVVASYVYYTEDQRRAAELGRPKLGGNRSLIAIDIDLMGPDGPRTVKGLIDSRLGGVFIKQLLAKELNLSIDSEPLAKYEALNGQKLYVAS